MCVVGHGEFISGNFEAWKTGSSFKLIEATAKHNLSESKQYKKKMDKKISKKYCITDRYFLQN